MNRARRGRRGKVSTVRVTEEETATEGEISPKIRKTGDVEAHEETLAAKQKTTATEPANPRSKEKKESFEVVEENSMISDCDTHENVDGEELKTTTTVDREELAINSITESSASNPEPSGSASSESTSKRITHPEARMIKSKNTYCDTDVTDFLDNLNCQLRETGRDEVLLTDLLSCFLEPDEYRRKPRTRSAKGKKSDSASNKNRSKSKAQLEDYEIKPENSFYQMDAKSFYYKLNAQLRKTGRSEVLLTDILSCFIEPNEHEIVKCMCQSRRARENQI